MTKLTLKNTLSSRTQEKLLELSRGAKPQEQDFKDAPRKEPAKKPEKFLVAKPSVPMAEEVTQQSQDKLKAAIAWLEASFPALFDFLRPKPLKLRINQEIIPLVPKEITKHQVKKALRFYVNNKAYREAILESGQRYDLTGQAVGEILEAHKKHAAKKLLSSAD